MQAKDPEGQTITYTLSGDDATLFDIDATTSKIFYLSIIQS